MDLVLSAEEKRERLLLLARRIVKVATIVTLATAITIVVYLAS